jgi:hypothetical protein
MQRSKRRPEGTRIPARLRRKYRLVFNEPTIKRPPDIVPTLAAVNVKALGAIVGARLILERELRICGLAKAGRPIQPTTAIRRVLLAMLAETDSPLSASLRMRAAAVAGPFKVRNAVPRLRRIALDEDEDLSTRLGAVRSYLHLAGRNGAAALRILLHSRYWPIRACAYGSAMMSGISSLRAIAQKQLPNERSDKVRSYVARYVDSVRTENSTGSDAR